uniref:Uncharacterized protein n=1 Tax=Zea mays TaxID=4577 RepID=C4IZT9_MAIZE|nr:unknown [Zea mays]
MIRLEQRGSLAFLVTTDLKVLAPLDRVLRVVLAALALQLQHNLLCCFCLLVENRLCLTTISRLFAVITSLPLS